jgi:glycerol-3-phosphate O-acyltransferase 1/2
MLAFILLTSYRKGATLRQLIPAMNWLKEELARKKRDVGFSGETADVIKYACSLLGRELVTTEVIQMAWASSRESLITQDNNRIKKIVLVKPAVKVPSVLELQYYSNSIASSFAMESIVGKISIFPLVMQAKKKDCMYCRMLIIITCL